MVRFFAYLNAPFWISFGMKTYFRRESTKRGRPFMRTDLRSELAVKFRKNVKDWFLSKATSFALLEAD